MTREQKIEEIRQWCIQANPDIKNREEVLHPQGLGFSASISVFETIGLADVLLAIQVGRKDANKHGYSIRHTGRFYRDNLSSISGVYMADWNLRKDDINDQSDEFIDFIHGLRK